ncbi:hypothetical protein [Streptomyces subrutilus]|uniref:hypothetical protein n=1 Tax=Streptomyces subrutilus TaxID=36818 RepID=UPI0034009894
MTPTAHDGDGAHRADPVHPAERLLREALDARAAGITGRELRPADPPGPHLRRSPSARLRGFALPLAALAAAAAALVGWFVLAPDPSPAPPAAPPELTTPAPVPTPTRPPTPTQGRTPEPAVPRVSASDSAASGAGSSPSASPPRQPQGVPSISHPPSSSPSARPGSASPGPGAR